MFENHFYLDLDNNEFTNSYLQDEIIVLNIILRIYNKNPAVFIGNKLNKFILEVSNNLVTVAEDIFKMG